MSTRIADRAIVTIQIIRWLVITAVMGLILMVVAESIYGSLTIRY